MSTNPFVLSIWGIIKHVYHLRNRIYNFLETVKRGKRRKSNDTKGMTQTNTLKG